MSDTSIRIVGLVVAILGILVVAAGWRREVQAGRAHREARPPYDWRTVEPPWHDDAA